MAQRQRSFWGWGYEDQGPDAAAREKIAAGLRERFDRADITPEAYPRIEDVDLPAPRVAAPAALADRFSDDARTRALHTFGASFRDVVRGFRREFRAPPDYVAYPENAAEIAQILDWCGDHRVAAIPVGGGSSVVGGIETDVGDAYAGCVSINLAKLDSVLEIDPTSRTARIQGGVYGPALEDQLRPHGLTLRHFPQSFEFSTLGGWIATRSGGHFAMRYTHIEDFVESLEVVTPRGVIVSRRLPGSGAGPSPDRMFAGSEGALGIITEASMRLQDRPTFRANASVAFPDFASGVAAVRALSQSGLYPSNCRLLDPGEAASQAGGDGTSAALMLAFESADHALDAWMFRAVELCRDHGGDVPDDAVRTRTAAGGAREGAAGQWRNAFIAAPYARDALVAMGMVVDTFETAIPWDRFETFHAEVMAAANDAVQRVCGAGTVTCRFTHVYPDGPAPYYSILAPGKKGSQVQMWDEIKAAVSDVLIGAGGTITHHHAIGRDHMPWYERQRPALFGDALAAAKRSLDPAHILNPGVIVAALAQETPR